MINRSATQRVQIGFVLTIGTLLLAGCASTPTGPSVMAMPGTGKSFDQFRYDDADCRQYAQSQLGTDANQAATDAGIKSAAIGTVIGAAAGAAMGGHEGAGIGAGTGLLFGSMAGTGAADSSANATQRRYDNAYVQCMYAKGEQVPVPAGMRSRMQRQGVAPSSTLPPPPPPSPINNYPPPARSGY